MLYAYEEESFLRSSFIQQVVRKSPFAGHISSVFLSCETSVIDDDGMECKTSRSIYYRGIVTKCSMEKMLCFHVITYSILFFSRMGNHFASSFIFYHFSIAVAALAVFKVQRIL